ncbi:MAG: tRNA (N6-threonylcarbamoyladenosine(37)-N6)-methyltransferase TrmO [Deltaproteobacteria bacterium]|nr:tRNA (N6-threonylcarbamoyladenosine(37)-N6)-methyltransferase TrmO [Deltaproteobacteria bacterium]
MILRVVGIICNNIKEPFLKAGDDGIKMQGSMDEIKKRVNESTNAVSEIIIGKQYIKLLDGIEEYSHLMVLYWGHRVPEASRLLTRVHPMGRKENPLRGIFSTCSPARPNPILMTVVRLHKREENILKVSGLDAIDRTPVIDIKPYVMDFYPRKEVRIPGWMRKIIDENYGGRK